MRILLFIVFGLLTSSAFSQQDSITIPTASIIDAAKTIQSQRDSIAFYKSLTTELYDRTDMYESLVNKQNVEITLLNRRIEISDGIVDRYQTQVKPDRRKWYQEPIVHYVGGVLTTWIASVIVSNVK